MSALARALLDDLGPDDLADLARRLAPYLPAPAPAPEDRWLTTREAADYLALLYSTLKKKMAAGEVPCEREGGRCYFRRADLDRWRGRGQVRISRRCQTAYGGRRPTTKAAPQRCSARGPAHEELTLMRSTDTTSRERVESPASGAGATRTRSPTATRRASSAAASFAAASWPPAPNWRARSRAGTAASDPGPTRA